MLLKGKGFFPPKYNLNMKSPINTTVTHLKS